MDKDIAAAAIERLEAERQRRLDERVAKGEAVRAPLYVVVSDPGQVEAEIESAKADKLAELRKAGETREIVFDEPWVINTGVPRGADFGKDWAPLPPTKPYDRHDAADESPKPAITRPSEEPAEPLVAHHRIHVQVAPPTERDPGAVIEGSYTLTESGVVRVYDADRNLLGSERLAPGADAGAAARRVLREKRAPQRLLGADPALIFNHRRLEHEGGCFSRRHSARPRSESWRC
jgi:hypothetical protein